METIEEVIEYLRSKVFCSIVDSIPTQHIKISAKTYLKAYNSIYRTYDENNARKLYLLYEDFLRDYCREEILHRLEVEDDRFIQTFVSNHENFKFLAFWSKRVFRYLERHFIKYTSLETFSHSAQLIFRQEVLTKVSPRLISIIIQYLETYRNDPEVDIHNLQNGIDMYSILLYYNPQLVKTDGKIEWAKYDKAPYDGDYKDEDFKAEILSGTEKYYRNKAETWMKDMNVREYILHLKKVFIHEDTVSELFLKDSAQKLKEVCINEMLIRYSDSIYSMLEDAKESLFNSEHEELLKGLYEVLKRHPEMNDKILDMLEIHIEEKGKQLVISTSNDKTFDLIPQILQLDEKTEDLISRCLSQNSGAKLRKRQAFTNFINFNFSVLCTICPYIDTFIKTQVSTLSDSDLQLIFSNLMKIISSIRDRDIFLSNYSRLLSDRLLNFNYSIESEISVVNLLRDEFGQNTVYKLQRMIQDIHTSESLINEFKSVVSESEDIEYHVTVINKGSWPVGNLDEFVIFPEMMRYKDLYNQFYIKKFEGRSLKWIYELGYMVIRTKFLSKIYNLVVNPVQGFVLNLFNTYDKLTVQEILDVIKMNERRFKASVINLFNPKMKILIKNSSGKLLNSTDEITVNSEFSNPSLQLNYISLKRPQIQPMRNEVDKAVIEDRKYTIDSIIVKICKNKKILSHTDLVHEVISACNTFLPTSAMIKAQIENLILREFLKRDDASPDTYIYIQEV